MSEDELATACLEGLRAALPPETEIELRPGVSAHRKVHPGGRLRIRGPWGEMALPCELKRRVNNTVIVLMDRRIREAGHGAGDVRGTPRWILFAEHVTPRQAHDLRADGIAFVDTRGNVQIWGPGLYVRVLGNKPAARKPKTPRLTRPAAARVLFALLQNPRRVQEPYRELAEQTGVAPDTVSRVFHDLRGKGYLKVWGRRERAVIRLTELMELWTVAYEDALRPKLEPKRCHWAGAKPVEQIANLLPLGPGEPPVLLGGEVAAALLTDMIRPTSATLYVPPGTQRAVMKALHLVPQPDGPVTLLHTFGVTNEWTPRKPAPAHLADPLLVHAELMREGDDRARMAAQAIYDRYIVRRFPDDQ